MRTFSCIAAAVSLALALGGCDDKGKPSKPPAGQATLVLGKTRIQVAEDRGASIALPSDMPGYAAVYPGAEVRAVVTLHDEAMAAMITYVTTAKPADIIAFHKKNAAAAGLEPSQDMQADGIWHFAAQKKGSHLTVTVVAENEAFSVQETYK